MRNNYYVLRKLPRTTNWVNIDKTFKTEAEAKQRAWWHEQRAP